MLKSTVNNSSSVYNALIIASLAPLRMTVSATMGLSLKVFRGEVLLIDISENVCFSLPEKELLQLSSEVVPAMPLRMPYLLRWGGYFMRYLHFRVLEGR